MQAPIFLCVSANANFSFPDHSRQRKAEKIRGQYGERLWGAAAFCLLFSFPICILPIYAVSLQWQKEHLRAPFFYALKGPTPPKETFHPTLRGVIRPEWPCIRGPFDLSFGPNELPSVAVRQNRLDLAGNLMGLTGRTRRMGKHGKASMGKLRVRLFRKI